MRARARNDVTDLNAQSIRPSTLHQFKHQAYNFGQNVNGNKILTQPTGKFRNQGKFSKIVQGFQLAKYPSRKCAYHLQFSIAILEL